jgi:hypothetical protein
MRFSRAGTRQSGQARRNKRLESAGRSGGSVSKKGWRRCRTGEMMIRYGGHDARSSSADR